MKKCQHCKEEKGLGEFGKNRSKPDRLSHYCKKCVSKTNRQQYVKQLDGYYSVYYLPGEHYCGVTNSVESRISDHRCHGKNIEGWRILFCSEDRKEAAYHEGLFQAVLGIEGLNFTSL